MTLPSEVVTHCFSPLLLHEVVKLCLGSSFWFSFLVSDLLAIIIMVGLEHKKLVSWS